MSSDEGLENVIRQTAEDPASFSVDGMSGASQDLSKLIETDRHLAANRAALQPHFGLRFAKLRPPRPGL